MLIGQLAIGETRVPISSRLPFPLGTTSPSRVENPLPQRHPEPTSETSIAAADNLAVHACPYR
jgi:hypothetical protein